MFLIRAHDNGIQSGPFPFSLSAIGLEITRLILSLYLAGPYALSSF